MCGKRSSRRYVIPAVPTILRMFSPSPSSYYYIIHSPSRSGKRHSRGLEIGRCRMLLLSFFFLAVSWLPSFCAHLLVFVHFMYNHISSCTLYDSLPSLGTHSSGTRGYRPSYHFFVRVIIPYIYSARPLSTFVMLLCPTCSSRTPLATTKLVIYYISGGHRSIEEALYEEQFTVT